MRLRHDGARIEGFMTTSDAVDGRALPVVDRTAPRVLGDGISMIHVPIPDNPLGHTLVYVLESAEGPVLIDAGWDADVTWDALTGGLRELGTRVEDVQGVLVTHHHPDHHGLSGRVRAASGAWIAMHEADAEIVDRFRVHLADRASSSQQMNRQLEVVGAPDTAAASMAVMRAEQAIRVPAVPDLHLRDGDLAPIADRLVRTIWTPGHSPGHSCFLLTREARLLSGDHLLPDITPHVGLYEMDLRIDIGDPLGEFLASMTMLKNLGVDEVLPAHRRPFSGLATRCDEILAHHVVRLDEMLVLLDVAAGVTLWDLASAMTWNRAWDELPVINQRIAVSEAAAHVRHMIGQGRVELLDGAPPRFRALIAEAAA